MNQHAGRGERYLTVELSRIHLLRGGKRILRDLRWRIRPGQRWILRGDNGAGKTQLLKLIAGDVWPQPRDGTRRNYRWRHQLYTEPQGVKEEIAYVGAERQDRYEHYGWDLRVTEIVGTGIERSDVPLRALSAAERSHVARLLRRVGIESLARRRFLTLSQGERRLVLLARVLHRLTLTISTGDCWIVHGPIGSGKSTLLAALHGNHGVAAGGTIWRLGQGSGAALSEFQRRTGYVAPELQAALPRQLSALEAVVAGGRRAAPLPWGAPPCCTTPGPARPRAGGGARRSSGPALDV